MSIQITLPSNTRVVGQGNPPIDMDLVVTRRIANDMMIDNVEAWLKGKPRYML